MPSNGDFPSSCTSAAREEGLRATRGRPLLLNLWASWCAPCIGELSELAERTTELDEAGLVLVALGKDHVELVDAARHDGQLCDHLSARSPALCR